MANEYTDLIKALNRSMEILEDGQLLDDGADNWDPDNLIEALRANCYDLEDDPNTYCLGWDGSIGKIEGDNVDWIYRVTK